MKYSARPNVRVVVLVGGGNKVIIQLGLSEQTRKGKMHLPFSLSGWDFLGWNPVHTYLFFSNSKSSILTISTTYTKYLKSDDKVIILKNWHILSSTSKSKMGVKHWPVGRMWWLETIYLAPIKSNWAPQPVIGFWNILKIWIRFTHFSLLLFAANEFLWENKLLISDHRLMMSFSA